MEKILNKLALRSFDILAAKRNFTFKPVDGQKEYDDLNRFYEQEGPTTDDQKAKVVKYRKGTINFIAYYRNEPIGMVQLVDPNVSGARAYQQFGVDQAGRHYSIQNLAVKKDLKEGEQFVMLGLFKEMYAYSQKYGITYWNSGGARNVYLTMRRYCQEIEKINIDFDSIRNPLTQYLCTKKIIETNFTLEVDALEPWKVLKKFMEHSANSLVRSIQFPSLPWLPGKLAVGN